MRSLVGSQRKRHKSWKVDSWPLLPWVIWSWKPRSYVRHFHPKKPICWVSWVSKTILHPETLMWNDSLSLMEEHQPEELRNDSQLARWLRFPPEGITTRRNLWAQVQIKTMSSPSTVTLISTVKFTLKSTFQCTTILVNIVVIFLPKLCI